MKKIAMIMSVAFFICVLAWGQTQQMKGTIKNEKGEPLPYATIKEVGTTNTGMADAQGNFTITAKMGARLIVSATGYDAQTVSVNGTGPIILKANAGQLNEVVVVAYGTQKRTNLTGSIAIVSSAELENKPFTAVDKSLQGAVAGLQSTSASGAPGAATDIRIRGIGSITAGAAPIYVIDGAIATPTEHTTSGITVTANALSTLNPDDIESITVLKDAASQSIYGSRAANGVILITTKKGKAGKSHMNFSTEIGQNSMAFRPKNRPVTTSEYQTLMRESIINAGYATDNAGADAIIIDPNGLGIDSNYTETNTNWLDVVTRSATQEQYNLSLSGGNDKTQIYASGGYFKQQGIVAFSDFERYNGNLSVSHKPNDKSLFSAGVNVGYVNQRTPLNSGYYANPASAPFLLNPWYSPYNADGSLKFGDAGNEFPLSGGLGFNPLAIGVYTNDRSLQTTFRGHLSGEYQLLDGLKFTTRYSGEFFNIQEDQYRSPIYGDGYPLGYGYSVYKRIYNWTWSNFADYRKAFNKAADIYLEVKLGYEAQQANEYVVASGANVFPQTLALQTLSSAATPTYAFTNKIEQATNSVFSLVGLNYKDRYVVSGSFRQDRSSVFGANKRSGNFYSVGATWNLNEESLIRNLSMINLLKLRSSYGESGNQSGIDYYSSQATFGYGLSTSGLVNYNYAGQIGSALNNVGNNDLTWEKNVIFNIGLDFGLFKNRLFGTIEYYNRRTSGLLINVPLSQTSGVAGQNRNVGAIVNKGFEITLGVKPIVTKGFSWIITGNLSHNTNKITELYLGNPVPDPNGNLFNYTVGHNIYEFYTRQWAGVDPSNGNPLWYTDASHGKTTSDISEASFSLSGKNALPSFFGSVTNSFAFKGLTLDAQFYYNYGNYIFMGFSRYINSDGANYGSGGQLSEQLDSWKKAGDITNTPKLIIGGNMVSNATSTRYLYKGDYIRLRNVQLSYNLPTTLLRKTHLATLNVYVRGTNLLTFGNDKRLPVDPENGIISTSDMNIFIPKTITAGVRIGL